MKIMNIILEARVGGPQLRIALVAEHLKKYHNIDTLIVFPKKNSEEYKQILERMGLTYKCITLHKLSKHPFALFKWLIFLPIEIYRLESLIKKLSPDVVHCNSSWQWKGVLAAKIAGSRIVWHLNDTSMILPIRSLFKSLVHYADGFITAGSRVNKYYLNHFKTNKPIFEILAPVDTKKYDPAIIIPDKKLNLMDGIKIITVGNINALKGIEYYIETAILLNKKHSGLQFIIVGKLLDSQKKYIKKLKKTIALNSLDNLYFLGSSDQIPELLKASDIYICSSISEASPQSVWEAMSMEKAIVSTDVGAVPDFINDGENGYIVPIRNPEKLAEKIDTLICNKELREQFGKKARTTAQRELDIKIVCQKQKECYELICSKKKQKIKTVLRDNCKNKLHEIKVK